MNNNLFQRATGASLVNISINAANNGKKISINDIMTLDALGVSLANQGEPAYPAQEIAALNLCGNLTPEQIMARTQDILAKWNAAKRAYAANGGQGLGDRIITAVLKHLREAHGMSEKNKDGWTITAGALALYPFEANGVVQFNVQGAPTWG